MTDLPISDPKTIPYSSKNFSNISDRYSSSEAAKRPNSTKENSAPTTTSDSVDDDANSLKDQSPP